MAENSGEDYPVQLFAAELRKLRQECGSPSFRDMARRAHFSSSTLAEAVQGRRLPSEAVVEAFAKACDADPGTWVDRWRDAGRAVTLARSEPARLERADDSVQEHRDVEHPTRDRRRPSVATTVGLVTVLALVGGFWVSKQALPGAAHTIQPTSSASATVRMGFEDDSKRWWVLYGSQVATLRATTGLSFEGSRSELVTVTGATADKGYSAVGISHDVGSLRSGMRVKLHLWVPGPQDGGVSFFVHDSRGRNHWAVENQSAGNQQTEMPLQAGPGWYPVSWTVPRVDTVTTIGMQIWAANSQPIVIGIDSVSW